MNTKKQSLLYKIIIISLTVISILFLLPIIGTITNSFMTSREINSRFNSPPIEGEGFLGYSRGFSLIPYPISLEQYFNILIKDYKYVFMFWTSLKIVVIITIFNIFTSLFTGFAFAKLRFPFKKILSGIYILVLFMPFSVTLLPNYILIRWLNLYDTHWALILPAIFAPLGTILIMGFANDIQDEYIEAATLETNSMLRIYINIIVPMLRPAIAVLVIITFAENWNMVEQPMVLLADSLKYPLSIALSNYNASSFTAFAGSVIYLAPIVILFLYFEDEIITEFLNMGGIENVKN